MQFRVISEEHTLLHVTRRSASIEILRDRHRPLRGLPGDLLTLMPVVLQLHVVGTADFVQLPRIVLARIETVRQTFGEAGIGTGGKVNQDRHRSRSNSALRSTRRRASPMYRSRPANRTSQSSRRSATVALAGCLLQIWQARSWRFSFVSSFSARKWFFIAVAAPTFSQSVASLVQPLPHAMLLRWQKQQRDV
jgi:hypothetical protein